MPGGGDGFGVYNSDPNSTRTQSNYSPYDYRQASERSYIGSPGGSLTGTNIPNTSTEVAKLMDMYPEYYEGKQLTGLPGAAQNYLKNSFLGKGLNALGDMLPVNRRAILENELLGSGMQLNDIGQFVSDGGDINKADGSNIMAGYNAAKVTQETFDKRRATIEKNMKDPKQKAAKLAALDAAEASFFGAKTKADMVFDDKSLAKDPTYKSLADKIATGNTINSEKENDEDGEASYYDPLNQIDSMPSFTGLNAPSTFTLTAPQYGTSFGQGYGSGYGPGDGTGSSGSYDEAGIDYGDGTGSSGSYDEAGVNTGSSYNAGSGYNATGQGGPAGQGTITNPSNYGTGTGNLGDYQMQPSKPEATFEDQSYSSGGGDGGNNSGGKSIVCTAMYQTTGLEDWSKAMKIWYIYQKKYLTIEHQEGYHKLFKPFVKGMHKSKIIKDIGAHVAKHRTQDLKHIMFGSKPSWLGRVYRKILEPICYFVGKNG